MQLIGLEYDDPPPAGRDGPALPQAPQGARHRLAGRPGCAGEIVLRQRNRDRPAGVRPGVRPERVDQVEQQPRHPAGDVVRAELQPAPVGLPQRLISSASRPSIAWGWARRNARNRSPLISTPSTASMAVTVADRGRRSSAANSPMRSPADRTARTASYPCGETDETFTVPRRMTTTWSAESPSVNSLSPGRYRRVCPAAQRTAISSLLSRKRIAPSSPRPGGGHPVVFSVGHNPDLSQGRDLSRGRRCPVRLP